MSWFGINGNYLRNAEMVDIKQTVKDMCKAAGGRVVVASALGMSLDQFNNHLYEKCGSRPLTLRELESIEDLSGTSLFAEYAALRAGKLLVENPKPDSIDNVDLFDIEMRIAATKGELAQAKMSAAEDGVIDNREKQKLWGLFNKKMRHQFHGMLGFLAMYGVSDGAVDLFITSNRKGDAPSMQLEASVASTSLCGEIIA